MDIVFYIIDKFTENDMKEFLEKNGYHLTDRISQYLEPYITSRIKGFKILKNDKTEDRNNIGKEVNSIIRKLDKLNIKHNHLFEEVNFSVSLY